MLKLQLRTDELTWRRAGDELIALDARAGVYLSVNAAGAQLWEQLAAGATVEELSAGLAGAHALEPATAREQAAAFVASLERQGLLASAW